MQADITNSGNMTIIVIDGNRDYELSMQGKFGNTLAMADVLEATIRNRCAQI